jgi:hypothetical protein
LETYPRVSRVTLCTGPLGWIGWASFWELHEQEIYSRIGRVAAEQDSFQVVIDKQESDDTDCMTTDQDICSRTEMAVNG